MVLFDPLSDTRPRRPSWSEVDTKPLQLRGTRRPINPVVRGCLTILLAVILSLLIYFFIPLRTNILILGTNSRDVGDPLGRTDTMIMATIIPSTPVVGLLSIPRDLWINDPDYGENRINTVFYFSELDEIGSGPQRTIAVMELIFVVDLDYYILVDFNGLREVVDAFGGLDIVLPRPMSGYDAGVVRLNGEQALAFVRDRANSDDFSRMERGQIFVESFIRELLRFSNWTRIPNLILPVSQLIETDIPLFLAPRLILALLRAGPDGIEGRVIDRDMVIPFTTAAGAAVLLPNWEAIDPVVEEIFR